ncbi:MAG: hypothetical protein KIT11_01670 [Fimbriimonadaceae bacterium]|nr:hypothetical protein [Fimbriimonadaceae bacterium]QYK54921.1 MAG: hypothetical protein KF733_07865 [Fimbriimonadaceae bacterium]
MRLAVVNYAIRPLGRPDDHFSHLAECLDRADGADWVLFPECLSLELLSAPRFTQATSQEAPGLLADFVADRLDAFAELAVERNQHIVFGTTFVRKGDRVLNTAHLVTPGGQTSLDLPKVVMTQFESVEWGVSAGAGLRALPDRRVGLTVCYDAEFPPSGRTLAEAGVLLQLVPAFTETRRGFQRVRWSCHARAVENQIFVAHASLVGSLGREPVPTTFGSSAILCPSVEPFHESAILAETPMGEEAVALADLDFDALHEARSSGDVRNWDDRDRGDWRVSSPTWIARSTSRPSSS